MAHVISISNHKGGVGKTTTAMHASAALAIRGYRTLLIDMDAQRNSTILVRAKSDGGTIYDALMGNACAPYRVQSGGYDIVPASRLLAGFDTEVMKRSDPYTVLRDTLKRWQDDYDYILLDTAPALGLSAINSAVAADSVIIPVQAQYMAVQGMCSLLDMLESVKKERNKGMHICGLLITIYDSRRMIDRLMADYIRKTYGSLVFDTVIRNYVTIVEAGVKGKSVFDYAPKSRGAADYANFADEMLRRISEY